MATMISAVSLMRAFLVGFLCTALATKGTALSAALWTTCLLVLAIVSGILTSKKTVSMIIKAVTAKAIKV